MLLKALLWVTIHTFFLNTVFGIKLFRLKMSNSMKCAKGHLTCALQYAHSHCGPFPAC